MAGPRLSTSQRVTISGINFHRLYRNYMVLPKKSTKKQEKRVRRVTDPDALKSFKERNSEFKKSKEALKLRFVWGDSGGHTGRELQNRINHSQRLKGAVIEELYPPDHWLHDTKLYDARKCGIFEGSGWKWTENKGADKGDRSRCDPQYRSPPTGNGDNL